MSGICSSRRAAKAQSKCHDKEQKDYKLTIKGHHTRRTLLHTEWEQYGGTMKKRKENIHLKKKGKDSELTITLPRYSGVLLKLTKKE